MKPWLKWHRARSQRFDALPVHARGLFAELLAHTDDEGWLRLCTDDRGTLWRFIGAHPKERRTLAKHLDTLESIGAVVVSEQGWEIPSFGRYQGDDPRSRKSTKRTRSVHGDDTERARSVHGNSSKPPEPFNTGPGESESDTERELIGAAHAQIGSADRVREPEPRARWIGLDIIEVTGAELRRRGKRWQTAGLDGDPGKVRPVVDALGGVPAVQALEWCRRWARDPGTTRFSVGSLATYVAVLANGESGWSKPRGQSMRRVATADEHRSGAEHFRSLGIEVIEEAAE